MAHTTAPISSSPVGTDLGKDPAHSAYVLLRLGFIALPLLMGLDKFTNLLTDWPHYLAPWLTDILPFSAQTAMYLIGIVEIVAAVAMVIRPRWAAWVVALWLAGIIINLLTYSGFYDVALRDFGLLIAAVTLGLLAQKYNRPRAKGVSA
jgi:hypothetical protein